MPGETVMLPQSLPLPATVPEYCDHGPPQSNFMMKSYIHLPTRTPLSLDTKLKLLQVFERPLKVRTPLPCMTTLSPRVRAAIELNAVGVKVYATLP